jgi:hypothetical protein
MNDKIAEKVKNILDAIFAETPEDQNEIVKTTLIEMHKSKTDRADRAIKESELAKISLEEFQNILNITKS